MADDHKDFDRRGYEVGYGKPPKANQIRKGEVRNPSGRPKKTTDISSLIEIELNRVITIKENGQEIRVRKREAVVRRLVNAALSGNPRQIEYLVRFCQQHGAGNPFVITDADRAAFDRELEHRKLPSSGSGARDGDDGTTD